MMTDEFLHAHLVHCANCRKTMARFDKLQRIHNAAADLFYAYIAHIDEKAAEFDEKYRNF